MALLEEDGFKFDLETQRFIKNRWETSIGKIALKEIVQGIKDNVEIRGILDDYVLDHPENSDPYAHPIYPKSEMEEGRFWVLTQDDLRGIQVFGEDFSTSRSLEKKALSYGYFSKCNFSNANIEQSELSYASFDDCEMQETVFAYSGGFSTRLLNCNLSKACCWGAGFIGCDFSGSDFSDAYFESAYLEDIKVNHKTRFDLELKVSWTSRSMPPDQAPDILRAIRAAYEKAEIWGYSDVFQYQEKVAQRKHILWPRLVEEKGLRQLFAWVGSLFSAMFSGHSTRPFRVIIVAFLIAVAFSGLYFLLGTPGQQQSGLAAVLESLYFSFTTFATLGYGDISYGANHPYLRLLSTIEAWVGAIFISMFVVVLSKKVFR